MRPLRLELEGFTAFRQPTCLDLSELDLFAITGPTGAGKSSLIDSVSYALYGRIPRVTNEVASCISQGLDRMRVALEFMAGEDRYRVFRETRRKGQPNARLDRWQKGEWRAIADRSVEVTNQVTAIVGLDYDAFTRSVLLPQGQFQEFLAGAADKRRAVLGSLLRLDVYDRARSRANGIAVEIKARIDERDRELAGLAEATPENLKRLQRELVEKQRIAVQLRSETQALAAAVELAQALARERERLCRAEAEVAAAENDRATTQALVEQGDDAIEVLQNEVAGLREKLAANQFDPERLTTLTLARERATDLARIEAELAVNEQALTADKLALAAAVAALEAHTQKQADAEADLTAAAAAFREAERHNLAAALQQGLHIGDTCPVCGGAVGELPAVGKNGLEAAKTRFETARRAEIATRQAVQAASTASTRASAASEAAEQRLSQLQLQAERQRSSVAEALCGEEDTSLTAIEASLAGLVAAKMERQRFEGDLQERSSEMEALKAQLEQARQALALVDQRVKVAQREGDEARQAVATATRVLEEIAAKAGWSEITAALTNGAEVSERLKGRLAAAQTEQQQTALRVGQLEERLQRLQDDIDKAKGLRRELEGLKKDYNVAADLAQMLMANRFQAFVQAEALATLAADGSRRLEQLSAGRYHLKVEEKGQDFEVIDQWNADQARSVKTLSGGETFLASLALSLALAESLPGLAASRRVVLDSIFLDEGFGSLDPEALDRAADALDALRGENRMVCVITHLQELAQRLPARIVVTKSESGSSAAIA